MTYIEKQYLAKTNYCYSFDEIANIMGCTKREVRSIYASAVRKLKEDIKFMSYFDEIPA